jgi:hypothetical protein
MHSPMDEILLIKSGEDIRKCTITTTHKFLSEKLTQFPAELITGNTCHKTPINYTKPINIHPKFHTTTISQNKGMV